MLRCGVPFGVRNEFLNRPEADVPHSISLRSLEAVNGKAVPQHVYGGTGGEEEV
jgi:hypothetical protein